MANMAVVGRPDAREGQSSGADEARTTSRPTAEPVDGLKRKLTTVLVADVAGYSRLMGRDEEGTHRRLEALLRLAVRPAISDRAGTLIKTTGDGLLAEFPSVVEALRCAMTIQQAATRSNEGFTTDRHILFRIGINLGDVIAEDDDIYGDGVNIAARLETLAEPGGIVVSRPVRDHVRDRLPVRFVDMGEQSVKNIVRPVRAFRVLADDGRPRRDGHPWTHVGRGAIVGGSAFAVALLIAGGLWRTGLAPVVSRPAPAPIVRPSNVSIAVLPFANLSGDAQQDYFADGITESLTTDLSRALPGSFVVSRGTAFTYKGRSVDAGQVGRDLNVRYLLQGSVLPHGDLVRVNAQLIDGQTRTELWSERFDKMRRDVLEVQDEIVSRLSRAVGLQVVDIEARRSERERAADPSAVDLVMRGQAIANRPASRETMKSARTLFLEALAHDPNNIDALAGLATTCVFEVLNSYYDDGRAERLAEATTLLRRALAAEPRHIVALKAHAALLRAEGRFDEAIAASRAVVTLNPGEPWAHKEIGLSELYLGRLTAALAAFDRADRIGPRDPSRWIWLGAMGRVQFFLDNTEEAVRLTRRSADANPRDPRAHAMLAAIYALEGRPEEAKSALAECLRLQPEMTIKRHFDTWSVPLQATASVYLRHHERLLQGLRLAGMPER